MNESHPYATFMRRAALPLLLSVAVVVVTLLVSGSALITIDDVQANRILAGTYGEPDWRVQDVNPLLAQVLTLLYRIIPSVNWYGVLLLGLLLLSASVAIAIAARKRGGLIPAFMVVAPLLVLFTYSLQSTVVCALCAATGALTLMDGVQRKKAGRLRAVLGIVLFCFAVSLHITWAVIIAAGVALCWLPLCIREERIRGILLGLPIMAILAVAFFGYSALMYASPNLAAYRADYAVYERLQHSSLREEQAELLAKYGTAVYSEGSGEPEEAYDDHDEHDHESDEDGEVSAEAIGPTSFDAVGWDVNAASLFYSRFSADAAITDPDSLRTLDESAKHISFDIARLSRGLFETVRKPQFLLLIGLFVLSAICVLVTARKRGFAVLLAAVIAFGGHIAALLAYYDSFDMIAPFYLIAIAVLLFHFDGESAREWLKRVFAAPGVRMIVCGAAVVIFGAALSGFLYFTSYTPVNSNAYTREAFEFIAPYIEAHPEMLFIGDNPYDRYKPNTLEVPRRGADANLLAGSYDLYSPRAAALMEKYGITNPLVDSVDREDIAYISMSFPEPMYLRLASVYGIYTRPPVSLVEQPYYSEKIFQMTAYTQEEINEILQKAEEERLYEEEQAALWDEFFALLPEDFDITELGELPEATEAPTEAPTQAPTPSPTPTQAPTATPTQKPTATPTASPTAKAAPATIAISTATPSPRPSASPTKAPTAAAATATPTASPQASAKTDG